MKSDKLNMAFKVSIGVLLSLATFSCRQATDTQSKDNTEDNQSVTDENYEVRIVYDSDYARAVPAFSESIPCEGPLGVIDPLPSSPVETDIADLGFYKLNNRMETRVWFINHTSDTIRVEALHLPDSRFKAEWDGRPDYSPNLMGGFKLFADSVEAVSDYRIVVTYRDKKYTPQAFHINLHPNIVKLRQEKGHM